jgi:hypothetical protein
MLEEAELERTLELVLLLATMTSQMQCAKCAKKISCHSHNSNIA